MATFTERYFLQGSLGGEDYKVSTSQTMTLTNVIDHVITLGTTEQTLFTDGSAVAGAQLTDAEVIYIENRDSTNYIELGLKQTGAADVVYVRVPAGRHFALYDLNFSADGSGAAIGTAAAIATVTARFNTAAGICRVFVGDDA